MEYTIATLLSVIVVILLDQILGTKLFFQKKFWIFYIFVIVLHTIVDNYLNGRWWLNEPIVGPYGDQFYSGIRVWHTPLENYFFGFSLITLNIILFEFYLKQKRLK